MPKEPASNIRFVCDEHAPKPQEKFAKMKPEEFIGKFVKLGFPTGMPGGGGMPTHEHMWVIVERVNDDVELIGILENHPTVVTDYKCGDGVGFQTNEIEEVKDMPQTRAKAPPSKR